MVAATGALAVQSSSFLARDSRCFELRTYTVAPGKFDTLHRRFQQHSLHVFQKHGMQVIGFWVPQDRPDTLVYLLAHPSREAAQAAWTAFRADPEWIAAQTESERDGALTTHVDSEFMTPTEYSPIR